MYEPEKKRNRNAIRSVNLIMEAYLDLMMNTPVEKITVTAIVNKAGLNRSTFYAHFECPADVHNLLEQRMVDEMFETMDQVDVAGLIDDPSPLLNVVAERIDSKMEYVKLIFEKNGAAFLLERIKELVIDKIISAAHESDIVENDKLKINLRFFIGGYISLCRDCIENKIDVPLQSFTNSLSKTIAAGLKV